MTVHIYNKNKDRAFCGIYGYGQDYISQYLVDTKLDRYKEIICKKCLKSYLKLRDI